MFTLCCTAVASSINDIWKEPSPHTAITGASGLASFTPIDAGTL